jgi:DNA-binding SARP family transcriptional activator/TolB-like protein
MEALGTGNESVLPPGRKTRALLAAVALSSPRPALRSRLAELLWTSRPDEMSRASLRQEIHRLREAMGHDGDSVLVVTRDHLALRPGTAWIDVDEVVQATLDQNTSLSLLENELLEGMDGINPSFDAFLCAERERLRDRARSLAEAVLKDQTEPEAELRAAQRLLKIDRAHEGAWRTLMRLHAARGEKGMAIESFDRCRAALADLMDASPSPETLALLAEIRRPPGAAIQAPPPAKEKPPANRAAAAPRREPPAAAGEARHLSCGCVGVMPLQPIGASAEEAHLAAGLSEAIAGALSRFRWMRVTAPAALHVGPEADGAPAAGRTDGLGFVLEGTVQKVRGQARVAVRLIDLRANSHVAWTCRFDRQTADLLGIQDEIAAEIAAQVDSEVLCAEGRHSALRPLDGASANDLALQAVPMIGRMDRAGFMQAGRLLADATALDPECASVHAWHAWWLTFLISQDWSEDRKAAVSQAGDLAERAIVLDPLDARSLAIAGHVRTFLDRRPREGAALHSLALASNPNLAMAWALSSFTQACLGNVTEAERQNNRYKRLSPFDPQAFLFDGFTVLIHLLKRDSKSAAAMGRAVSEMNPAFSANFKLHLAALGHLGDAREADAVRRRLLAIEPAFTVSGFLATTPLGNEADRMYCAEGLRRAGVPERPGVAGRPAASANTGSVASAVHARNSMSGNAASRLRG